MGKSGNVGNGKECYEKKKCGTWKDKDDKAIICEGNIGDDCPLGLSS